jgi:monooxygenase
MDTITPTEHFDVAIIGAGISGIGAAHYLEQHFPHKTYVILEARDRLGGTWDLFRYPGIRSDSDMHTLGYRFKPWAAAQSIADGPSILEYVKETAREDGSERHIRYGHKVSRADWSTPDARWTITAEHEGGPVEITCGFVMSCSGYYRYDEGYTPELPGLDRYQGTLIHPQHWPEDLDYSGKRVVVIGSGATAITLVPAMADTAEHVTMLQRSPTYVVSLPGKDPIARVLRKVLPEKAAYAAVRWKNVALQAYSYRLARKYPQFFANFIRTGVKRRLPKDFDIDTHFKPSYKPWDQRLCVVPDSDLFKAIKKRRASVVTDKIRTFTETGIELESGATLEADIIITATGLNMQMVGGVEGYVDGEKIDIPARMTYKAMMLEGVPNFIFAIGYTNASWTLKVDLVCEYACRLMAHMDANGYTMAMPVNDDPTVTEEPIMDMTSGYVLRALDKLPKQGNKEPWKLRQNYAYDAMSLRRGKVEDGVMRFSAPDRMRAGSPTAIAA